MGAGFVNLFIGRSDDEIAAYTRLIEQEDKIFKIQPGEDKSLSIHVQADVPRHQLLNVRQKLTAATGARKSDRNFYATVIIGIAVFIKSGISWHEVGTFLASLF